MKLSMASGGLYVKAALALLVVPAKPCVVKVYCLLHARDVDHYYLHVGNDKVLAKYEIGITNSRKAAQSRGSLFPWYSNEGLVSGEVT